MDNKYEVGSTKLVASKSQDEQQHQCRFCGGATLVLSKTLHDSRCADCGEWQEETPAGYSSGRSPDY